jgi:hypothetical protein
MGEGHDLPTTASDAVEDAFARLLDRHPSAEERDRLRRVRDALGVRDNDALWTVVLALEHYDGLFRAYPAQLAAATADVLQGVRLASVAVAEQEVAHAHRALAVRLSGESVRLARELAARPVSVPAISLGLALLVAFGVLCMRAGYGLGARGGALAVPSTGSGPGRALAAALLGLPAGWMIVALLVPMTVYGARMGWERASDPNDSPRERLLGGCILAACIVGSVLSAALVAYVT